MPQPKPSWMEQEEGRAEDLKKTGQTGNALAPKLVKVFKAPVRMQKALYIQPQYAAAFEDLVHAQKKIKGKKAPELAEEALALLLKKYGADTKSL